MGKQEWFGVAARIVLVLVGLLVLTRCGSTAKVGAMQTESHSVELGGARSVRVEIAMGAGDLELAGGAEKLLDAGFVYNVAKLKPEVKYADGTLVVRQPDAQGFPTVQNIAGFRNKWDLRLNDEVPMDLRVDVGAGASRLRLADLSLTGLDAKLGAGMYTIDLRGDWAHDLTAAIEAGAASVSVLLPKDIGARVRVESGPHTVAAIGLTQDGDAYVNAAYGVSDVTLQVDLEVGVGQINLAVEE